MTTIIQFIRQAQPKLVVRLAGPEQQPPTVGDFVTIEAVSYRVIAREYSIIETLPIQTLAPTVDIILETIGPASATIQR